jgi:hypothetical protein
MAMNSSFGIAAWSAPNVEVTGAARLYRAASVWTAGLGDVPLQAIAIRTDAAKLSGRNALKQLRSVAFVTSGMLVQECIVGAPAKSRTSQLKIGRGEWLSKTPLFHGKYDFCIDSM